MKRIIEELNKGITGNYEQPYEDELIILLSSLRAREKKIIANHFVNTPWNVGSLEILLKLQQTQILTATEYILSQNNEITEPDHIQLVLSDFLEAHFKLLANFLKNCEYCDNLKLISLLEVCVFSLLKDFEINQNIIPVNYLNEIKPLVEEVIYTNFKILHLNGLMQLDEVSIKIAFNEVENWTKNFISEESNYLKILKELIVDNSNALKKYILQPATDSNFKNWKYYVILLHIGTKFSNSDFRKAVKIHLRNLFKSLIVKMTKELCLNLLITGRVFCIAEADNKEMALENYFQWYKSVFGDMKYTLSTIEFKNVMTILTELIEFERSSTFLQVHCSISINAPALCNGIVLQYKNDCRKKVSLLNTKLCSTKEICDANKIIIDDDDD